MCEGHAEEGLEHVLNVWGGCGARMLEHGSIVGVVGAACCMCG